MAGRDTDPTEAALRADVSALAALDRPPCSPGEHEAAERIAAALRQAGARVAIDEEPVHGTYFWPMGLSNALGLAGGIAVLRGRRIAGAAAGAVAAAAIWQDLTGGPRRALRRLLWKRPTWNVRADLGDPAAAHTLVIHAHHDAAHTSPIFGQTLPRLLHEHFPRRMATMDRWPPLMGLVVGGPLLVALSAIAGRRAAVAGSVLAGGTAVVMADIGRRPVVPGANDNLTGVAVLLEVARRLRDAPPPAGLRVVLLSAGAEEGNQAGMLAYAARHFGDLDPGRTSFLCLDTLGSRDLVLIEGEGFLRMYEYPLEMKERVAAAARATGVHVNRGMHFTFATDGLVPLRRGYQVASVGSVNEWKVPAHYHMPTDTADNVDYGTVSQATDLVLEVIRSAVAGPAPAPARAS